MVIAYLLHVEDEHINLEAPQHLLIWLTRHVRTEQSLLRRQHLAADSEVTPEIYTQNPELAQNQQQRSMLKAALHSDS